jgi:hypothetical protein
MTFELMLVLGFRDVAIPIPNGIGGYWESLLDSHVIVTMIMK